MLKSFLFFLCVVAAGVRLGFFGWCESNVAHSEIFCFGQGRYWRGRGGGEAVQPKMGVRFRQAMVRWQGWEIHEGHEGARRVGRGTQGGEGHEGWGGRCGGN